MGRAGFRELDSVNTNLSLVVSSIFPTLLSCPSSDGDPWDDSTVASPPSSTSSVRTEKCSLEQPLLNKGVTESSKVSQLKHYPVRR